ncbi:MAG: hypothetical protein AAGN66_17880 [Acidobacteriota bacterium]
MASPKKKRRPDLDHAPPTDRFRAAPSKGFSAAPNVDREGGLYGAGIIPQVSLITCGEALGHYKWIDETFVQQVHDAVLAAGDEGVGVKSRFTHPGMSSDGLGKTVGRARDPQISDDGRQVYADLHILESAHRAPDGNLASYVMDLAEEDPETFAISIVFDRDVLAEEEFKLANSKAPAPGESPFFESPDPDNVEHYDHVRLASLHAADFVDEPAANPGGLFHRVDVPAEATAAVAFVLGQSDEAPAETFGVHPERARQFVGRYLANEGLAVVDVTEVPGTEEHTTGDAAAEAVLSRHVSPDQRDHERNLLAALTDDLRTAHLDRLRNQPAHGWLREEAAADTARWAEQLGEGRQLTPAMASAGARALYECLRLADLADDGLKVEVDGESRPAYEVLTDVLAAAPKHTDLLSGGELADEDDSGPGGVPDPRPQHVRDLHTRMGITPERYQEIRDRFPQN